MERVQNLIQLELGKLLRHGKGNWANLADSKPPWPVEPYLLVLVMGHPLNDL